MWYIARLFESFSTEKISKRDESLLEDLSKGFKLKSLYTIGDIKNGL